MFGVHILTLLKRRMAAIAEAAERGKLVPVIGRRAPLSEAISAIFELEMTGFPRESW